MEASTSGDVIVGVCLDESGSMFPVQAVTIKAFNDFAETLRGQAGETRVSLTMFSEMSAMEPTFRSFAVASDIKFLAKLTPETYNPRGNTPLYDAVGDTITRLEAWVASQGKPWTVLFVIQTDGQENSSREWTRERTFDLIRRKEAEGWKFIYLGADQDMFTARAAAVAMGMSAGSSIAYASATSASAFGAVGQTVSSVRSSPSLSSDELAEETRADYERRVREGTSSSNNSSSQ